MTRPKTISLGTETTWGFIRHRTIHAPGISIDAPVVLETACRRPVMKVVDGEYLPAPRHIEGRLLYALPGGGVTTGDSP